jgi:hypothetical protein
MKFINATHNGLNLDMGGDWDALLELLHQVYLMDAPLGSLKLKALVSIGFDMRRAAEVYANNWDKFWAENFEEGNLIVEYIDQSGELYMPRYEQVKALFPNFNY